MFSFALLTPTNPTDTTSKNYSFKNLHYGNIYFFGFLPFFFFPGHRGSQNFRDLADEHFSNGSFFHIEITTGFKYLLV